MLLALSIGNFRVTTKEVAMRFLRGALESNTSFSEARNLRTLRAVHPCFKGWPYDQSLMK